MASAKSALNGRQPDGVQDNVEIRVTGLSQLFNALDPSPIPKRELDPDADAYIVDSVDEFPLSTPLRLVIHLPGDQFDLPECRGLETAIRNHFAYRLLEARRQMRFLFRQGRMALLIGVGFLVLCSGIRELAFAFVPGAVSRILDEGLLILGWVAMWRPLEIFLYDWWPIRHRCQIFRKLAAMGVEARRIDALE